MGLLDARTLDNEASAVGQCVGEPDNFEPDPDLKFGFENYGSGSPLILTSIIFIPFKLNTRFLLEDHII